MKIALDWIGDYLAPVPAAQVAAEALMNAGLPVESVHDALGAKAPTQVLDVEVTSNRTDCFSHVGLARELGALLGGSFKVPAISIEEHGAAARVSVEVEDSEACPYYSARLIRNVKVGPSPEWLRRRLESIGLRPINNVVDVTNYVLMELGQPLHAFDFDRLGGQRIVVRRARAGEKMTAIDGRDYALEPSMLVIADDARPAAIAGVMGGKNTEVTESTVNVLLESARFEPLTIRTTSRALALKSDSSYRFERGIDPTMADLASRRAAQLIQQVAGGELAPGVAAVGSAKPRSIQVDMRMKRFQQIMGISISAERATAILNALGFAAWLNENNPGSEDDIISVRIPPHRLDVDREIDLIEEIARVHGYRHVPTLDRVTHAVKPEPPREKAERIIRQAFVEAGYSEAVTVTFIAESDATAFTEEGGGSLIHPQHGGWKSDVLRPSVLPSLLAVRRTNQYGGLSDAHLFEVAEVYLQKSEPAAPPAKRKVVSAVAGELSRLTGLLPLLAQRLNPAARMWVEPRDSAGFVRGASGEVMLQTASLKTSLGRVGLITPELQRKFDLRHQVWAIELDWELLVDIFQPVRQAQPVPRFPGVKRDLSVVVDEATRWADLKGAVESAQLAFLEAIDFVTTFRSAQVGAGKKSLTLTLDFRDPARTLKSEEVDAQVATAVGVLKDRFGAVLRA